MSVSDLERGLGQRLLRNLTMQSVTQAVAIVLGIITPWVLTRRLDAEGFGGFNYMLGFTMLFLAFSDLGTTVTLVREVAQEPERTREFVQNALGLRLVMSVAALVVGYLVVAVLPMLPHVAPLPPAYRLALHVYLWILPIQAFSVLAVVLHARLMIGRGQLVELANRLTGFTLMMASVWSGHGLLFVTLSLIAGELVGAVCLVAATRKIVPPWPRFSREQWRHLLALSLPLSGNSLLVQMLNRFDQVMLQALSSLNQLAYYGAALRLPSLFERLPQLANATMFPVMSRLAVEDPRALRRVYLKMWFGMVVFVVPMVAGTMVLAPFIVGVWFTPDYAPAVALMRVVILATGLMYVAFAGGNVLIVLRRNGDTLVAMGWAAGVNMVLNVLWIPRHGALGAAWATVAGYAVLCVLTLAYAEAAMRRLLSDVELGASS